MSMNGAPEGAMGKVHLHGYMEEHGFRYLSTYTTEEIQHRLDTYYKYTLIRHPLERLVSAYKDKFCKDHDYFYKQYAEEVIRMGGNNTTSDDNTDQPSNLTFQVFVEYLIQKYTKDGGSYRYNKHWKPFYQLCYPCFVHYDFIGRFENLHKDAQFLITNLTSTNVNRNISFAYQAPAAKNVYKDYIKELSEDQLTKLYEIYGIDFELFNYTFESDT